MMTTAAVKTLENAGFGVMKAEEYLNLPESKSDYERGVVDTLHFLAGQILFLDKFYEGRTEAELEDAVGNYMSSILRNVALVDTPAESFELVTLNALLQAIKYERATLQ